MTAGRSDLPSDAVARLEMLMTYGFMDVAVTPGVRAVQAELGVDHMWRDFKGDRRFDRFREDELAFIAERDTFYIATVSETGWPYVQHRGGPRGFLKAADDRTLVFGDYSGNFQFLSLGNLSTNDRASLILMDYPRRRRLKILAHVEVIDAATDTELTELVTPPGGAKPVRVFKLDLVAFDWNCPKYIVPRYTEDEIAHAILPLRERIAQLEAENAMLQAGRAPQDCEASQGAPRHWPAGLLRACRSAGGRLSVSSPTAASQP